MDQSQIPIDFEVILERLNHFFPATPFTIESVKKAIQSRQIIYNPNDFVSYLQTALLDEKLVEVRFDDNDNLFFTKIIDSPHKEDDPTVQTGENETFSYTPGKYITRLTHITSLPLEPGIGNYHIRNSKKVVMRIFTKSFAFEYGTFFREVSANKNIPALDFDFPVIGRLLHGEREYRAKVTGDLDLIVKITGKRKQPDIITRVIDISASGMAFTLKKHDMKQFFIKETRAFSITLGDDHIIDVKGKVIHVTSVRKPYGVTYICGVELDLVTRKSVAQIESLVAKVQRAHLKAISGLSLETGFKLIV